jgi:hypothetical protein
MLLSNWLPAHDSRFSGPGTRSVKILSIAAMSERLPWATGIVRTPKVGPTSVRVPNSLDQSTRHRSVDKTLARPDSDWSTS